MRFSGVFTFASVLLLSSSAAFAAETGNWSGSVEGMSKYVCQSFASMCSDHPVAQGSLTYDFGKDAIGTGGDNALNIWASTGAGGYADELDFTFSDAHTTVTLAGPVNWSWSVGYSFYNSAPGHLFAAHDDMIDFGFQAGQDYDLGTVGGVGITVSPYVKMIYWRGLGVFADYDDAGISLPVTLHFSKRWYGTFTAARLWSLSRHYPSPWQLTSTLGYRFADHWAVYVKYKGVKAHSLAPHGSYIDYASYGAGISFTGL